MGLFKKIRDKIRGGVKKLVKGVKKVVKKVASSKALKVIAAVALAVAMPQLMVSVGNWMAASNTYLVAQTGKGIAAVGSFFGGTGAGATALGGGSAAGAVPTTTNGLWTKIMEGVNRAGSAVINTVKNAWQGEAGTGGFRGWFTNKYPQVADKFSSLSGAVKTGIDTVFGIPSSISPQAVGALPNQTVVRTVTNSAGLPTTVTASVPSLPATPTGTSAQRLGASLAKKGLESLASGEDDEDTLDPDTVSSIMERYYGNDVYASSRKEAYSPAFEQLSFAQSPFNEAGAYYLSDTLTSEWNNYNNTFNRLGLQAI